MKPELEQLNLKASEQSFRFFKTEVDAFIPFWHYHPELELTLIFKGEGTRFVGDSIEPFTDYDLVLLGKNLPHHWVSLSENYTHKQKAIVFQFNEDMFQTFQECKDLNSLFSFAKRGIHFNNPSEDLLKTILNFKNLNTISQLGTLILLLERLSKHKDKRILASESYITIQEPRVTEHKFSNVNNYILEHLSQKLTIDQMANITHMVPQSFCRWFKKHSGHSFVSFLNLSRIERVCQLLLTSSDSIQDIAFNCGFETLSHFNRTFKTLKGCNPRTYRDNGIGSVSN